MQDMATFSFRAADQSKQVPILSVANLMEFLRNKKFPDPEGIIEFYAKFRSLLVEFKNLKNVQENTERQFAVWVVMPLSEFSLIIKQGEAFEHAQNKARLLDWLGNLQVSLKTFATMCPAWCKAGEPLEEIKRILAECQACSHKLLERLHA